MGCLGDLEVALEHLEARVDKLHAVENGRIEGKSIRLIRRVRPDAAAQRGLLLVAEHVLLKRRKSWKLPAAPLERGYWKLYFDHVLQASEGADLDFLVGKSGAFVPRDNH